MHEDARGETRGIARRELEAVIRRAAELHLAETDAEERVSEEDLLRIAAELGLPRRHVRQALYELPRRPPETGSVHRIFGPGTVVAGRTLPGDVTAHRNRLTEYLTTREYLQLRRRRDPFAWFEPADDTISNLVRALRRPAHRFHLARARRVGVAVRPLDANLCHVRLELDLHDRRRAALAGGLALGGIGGVGLAGGAVITLAAVTGLPFDSATGSLAAAFTAGTAFAAGLAAGVGTVAARFRRRVAAARLELHGLLDRLESGERLEPPPAPWWRRLRAAAQSPLPPHR